METPQVSAQQAQADTLPLAEVVKPSLWSIGQGSESQLRQKREAVYKLKDTSAWTCVWVPSVRYLINHQRAAMSHKASSGSFTESDL